MRPCQSSSSVGRSASALLLLALLAWGFATWPPAPLRAQDVGGPSLVVLVRHAEKDGPSADDPGLTEIGSQRAAELARLLGEAEITRIHSSDTRRTRETATPLAEELGLAIEVYDPYELEGLATRLATAPGRHLVVGHSNTTDEMSGMLGGATFGTMAEEWEYDRLYFLTPRPGGGMETVMIRFGLPVDHP